MDFSGIFRQREVLLKHKVTGRFSFKYMLQVEEREVLHIHEDGIFNPEVHLGKIYADLHELCVVGETVFGGFPEVYVHIIKLA